MSNEEIQIKAKELVERFIQASVVTDDGETFYHPKPFCVAKQCALIAVQNTIDALSEYDKRTEEYLRKQFPNYFSSELQNMESDFRYWDKVRNAIESL